jgi:hypothetical protein
VVKQFSVQLSAANISFLQSLVIEARDEVKAHLDDPKRDGRALDGIARWSLARCDELLEEFSAAKIVLAKPGEPG